MPNTEWPIEDIKYNEMQLAMLREAAYRVAQRNSDDDEPVCAWLTQHGTTGQWS